jgi:hypothetical protein
MHCVSWIFVLTVLKSDASAVEVEAVEVPSIF